MYIVKKYVVAIQYTIIRLTLYTKKKEYNKQNKGVWGMPRLSEAKKGVISCEKLRGRAHID